MARVFTITEGLENMGALKTGGQGSVYKGRRYGPILTAVKLLPTPIHSESPDDRHFADFQNEVAKLQKVNEVPNPNVVKILSSGITETGNLPFIEMEFIEGPDLEELLKPPHDPLFTIKETIKVADQLAHALAHCHRVGVRHGDLKSNNVKLNVHTGNYVLLDFGMAVMSDEQRRTSLRQAGAIEFMAPEQSEGRLLFQTDVYSYGIILYELLAGVVPFPLADKSEMARNTVMLAHMEKSLPDLMELRSRNLPPDWDGVKKEREMLVPDLLLQTIKRCLEKRPEDRFADGAALHEHIVYQSTRTSAAAETGSSRLAALQQEHAQLQREHEHLQELLAQVRNRPPLKQPKTPRVRKGMSPAALMLLVALIAAILGGMLGAALASRNEPAAATEPLITDTASTNDRSREAERNASRQEAQPQPAEEPVDYLEPLPQETINTDGQAGTFGPDTGTEAPPAAAITAYRVAVPRAYFHNEPRGDTRRDAYMVPSDEVIYAQDFYNGFVYVSFTNDRGQRSRGWLRLADLEPAF